MTDVFDAHAVRYDQWFERHPAVYRAELRAVEDLWPAVERGVEIGVGSGRFALPLGIRHGVDPAAGMRRLARERGIEAVEGVAERLPYPSDSFDAVLLVTNICFVADPLAAAEEAWRILRPGGSVVVGFIDRDSALGQTYCGEVGRGSPFYRRARFFGAAEGYGRGLFVAVRGSKTETER